MSAPDQVRILADNPTADDRLDRSRLVHAVSSLIATARPPLTVAVYGEWGSGKSSFMDRVRACLDPVVRKGLPEEVRNALPDLGPKADFVTVKFNLWEHQFDVNPVVAMLEAARQELSRRLDAKGWKGKLQSAWYNQLAGLLQGALVAMADAPKQVAGRLGGVNVASLVPSGGTVLEKIHEAKQARFAVQEEQTRLKSTFDDVIGALLKSHAAQDRVEPSAKPRRRWGSVEPEDDTPPWLKAAVPTDAPHIVFFIDDLDRCPAGLAVDLLEKIRLFLNQEHCVFVLGADEAVVKRAIVKARELCDYVLTSTQASPARFRFTFVTKLRNLALGIVESCFRANEVFIGPRAPARRAVTPRIRWRVRCARKLRALVRAHAT